MLETDKHHSLADRRRDATREGIVEAAWAICRRDGLGALSLRDLGREVGLKASSLYAYFDSKSAIYDAMFRQGYEQFAELTPVWGTGLDDGDLPRTVFKRAAHAFHEFSSSDPVRYQLMFHRVIPDFEPTPETYAVSVRQFEHASELFRQLGVTDPRDMDLWTAIASGLADQQIANDPGGDRWGRLVDTAVDLFCDHAGIPREGDQP